MKEVVFPGINLKLSVSNIAFELFGIKVYWYGILIIFAMALTVIFMKKENGRYGIKFDDILELMVCLIPTSIIGARIYFVCFKIDYYLANPQNLFNIRDGGLAIYGGIIAGILTIIIFSKIKKIRILDMLDFFAPYLALGQSIGRWGNFFNVEAHGYETTSFLRMGIVENGIYTEVHPTFLYESIITLFLFIFLMIIRNKREYSGQMTYIYFAIYSLGRFFIEGLRTDSLMIGNIRISQLLSMILFVTFSSILLYKKIKIDKKKIMNDKTKNVKRDSKSISN